MVDKNKSKHPNFPNYWVYKSGKITDLNRKRIEEFYQSNRKYKVIKLKTKDNKWMVQPVHKIIAETFLQKTKLFNSIDHLDNNRENNSLNNLIYINEAFNRIDGMLEGTLQYLSWDEFMICFNWLCNKVILKKHLRTEHKKEKR